jgi:hypothetical protein
MAQLEAKINVNLLKISNRCNNSLHCFLGSNFEDTVEHLATKRISMLFDLSCKKGFALN